MIGMLAKNSLKFSSGRSVSRLKQDAKALAKSRGIPLHQALDEISRINGGSDNWTESVRAIEAQQSKRNLKPKLAAQSRLASELGITDEELEFLSWEVQENSSDDGLVYSYFLTFYEDGPPGILAKIDGLSEELSVEVSANAFDEEPDSHDDILEPGSQKTNMNPHRKLLVLGVNELLIRGLISLDWDGSSIEGAAHIEVVLAGHSSIVAWSGIGLGEIRVSVWWKYDHSNHPQANLSGSHREKFLPGSPLAKRQHYPKFVAAVSGGWLERKDGKYLMGKGNQGVLDRYIGRAESEYLVNMPNPVPLGFAQEGRFHF
jgi:hypothetical protein